MPNVLKLKWGTVKGWDLETQEAKDALQKWADFGVSMSATAQRDAPGQMEALCDAIDLMDEIWLDWDGRNVSREDAKEYVRTYRA